MPAATDNDKDQHKGGSFGVSSLKKICVKENINMKQFECVCSYIYDPAVGDPDGGIAPGTAFEDIPEDWVCPVCGLGKDAFHPIDG